MISIRKCNETDLPSCGVLLKQVYAEAPYGEHWSENRATAYLESFFRLDSDGVFVAADDAGKTVGAVFVFSYPYVLDPLSLYKSYLLPASIVVKELPGIL